MVRNDLVLENRERLLFVIIVLSNNEHFRYFFLKRHLTINNIRALSVISPIHTPSYHPLFMFLQISDNPVNAI